MWERFTKMRLHQITPCGPPRVDNKQNSYIKAKMYNVNIINHEPKSSAETRTLYVCTRHTTTQQRAHSLLIKLLDNNCLT